MSPAFVKEACVCPLLLFKRHVCVPLLMFRKHVMAPCFCLAPAFV